MCPFTHKYFERPLYSGLKVEGGAQAWALLLLDGAKEIILLRWKAVTGTRKEHGGQGAWRGEYLLVPEDGGAAGGQKSN